MKQNEIGKDYIIGDLHGHYDLLMQKLNEVNFNKKTDRLFSVGDLIDRGPKSLDCLSLVFESWFHAVRGNHEQMMFDALLKGDNSSLNLWLHNGGDWMYEENIETLTEIAKKAELVMPYWMTVDIDDATIGIVHAQPPVNWSFIDEWDKNELIWSRNKINCNNFQSIENIDQVYVGHTPVKEVFFLGNTKYIDTGAFYTGKLTLELM